MIKKSKTVVFFGNEQIATGVTTSTPTIKALIKAEFTIAAIITNQSNVTSRKQKINPITIVAQKHGIPLLSPHNVRDITQQIQEMNADIGVLVAYGQIIPQSIIDLFPYGIINIHPSLLPKHRGSAPIESVILDGDTETGVSIMQLVRAMDAGPIYDQSIVELVGKETKQGLSEKLLDIGSRMIVETLHQIFSNSQVPIPQNEAEATTDIQIQKNDGVLNWDLSAERLSRQIRAFSDWPGSKATLGSIDVVITEARAIPIEGGLGQAGSLLVTKDSLTVTTADGGLVIDRLKPLGKNEMTIKEFLSGYSSRL
ncbi:MAG: methionyl-tRNA formyltransferase [Candidatus Saccharibacteria bacterium]